MANEYAVNSADLTAVADAIRTKGETADQLVFPDGFAEAIANIKAGEDVEQATPTISVSSDGLITASATQEAGLVPAGTKSATKQLTVQAAQTITPGTSDKTIASGRYLTGTQTIKGDANLVAENIKSGVSIFGVAGTVESVEFPEFTYTGTYTLVDDGGGNWRIRFLTSGTLTMQNGVSVDVFCVGGGGSGSKDSSEVSGGAGAGGFTNTLRNIYLTKGASYSVVVGAGGASVSSNDNGKSGGSSKFGDSLLVANGGGGGYKDWGRGGHGGSGGAARNGTTGGKDGGNGTGSGQCTPGNGQGTTTREFGETGGNLYATGGNTYTYMNATYPGDANTGDGGDGSKSGSSGAGGSGIVIIRNAR